MTSISFHIGGNSTGNVSIEHNNRTFKKHKNRDIDVSKSAQNIQFKKSKSVKSAYNQIFEPYTEKYDKKQKRNDRKIGNYYEHLSNQKGGKGGQKDRNLVYESISTIGKTDFENGKPKPLSQKELDFKKQVLKKAEEGWNEAHPNMIVINSVMHLDESNPHIHRDFVPVFHSKTGQELQVSLNKAIAEELGVAARRVPVRKLSKKTGKYEQVFYKNGQPKIKLDNKANFRIWSELERDRIAEIARTIDPNFERTKTDEVDHQSVAKYKERQAYDKLEKTDEKLDRVNALEEEVSHEAADTGLTQAYFIAELMPDYAVSTLEGEKSISTFVGKASFAAYESDKRLMALQTAMNYQKKQANCELIRDYEPEARVEYSKKDDNEEPRKSEPIKTEEGFKAFMDQPLEWLKKEKEKYKKIIKKKYEDLKKTIKAQGFEIETLSKKNKILNSKVAEAYDYLDKFNAKTKRMSHNIKIKNQTITDLKSDKTKLSTDLENTKNELENTKNENNQLKTDKTKLSSDLENAKNENNQLKTDKTKLDLENAKNKNNQLKADLGNAQERDENGLTYTQHKVNEVLSSLWHTDEQPIEERDENGLTNTQHSRIDEINQIFKQHLLSLGDFQMGYDGKTLREHEAEKNHTKLFGKKLTKDQIKVVYATNEYLSAAGLPGYRINDYGLSQKYAEENQIAQPQEQTRKTTTYHQIKHLKIEHSQNKQEQKRKGPSM